MNIEAVSRFYYQCYSSPLKTQRGGSFVIIKNWKLLCRKSYRKILYYCIECCLLLPYVASSNRSLCLEKAMKKGPYTEILSSKSCRKYIECWLLRLGGSFEIVKNWEFHEIKVIANIGIICRRFKPTPDGAVALL